MIVLSHIHTTVRIRLHTTKVRMGTKYLPANYDQYTFNHYTSYLVITTMYAWTNHSYAGQPNNSHRNDSMLALGPGGGLGTSTM